MRIARLLRRAWSLLGELPKLVTLAERLDMILLAVGSQRASATRGADYAHLRTAEFRVFSQWGEDGIIQYLIGKVPIENDTFLEIGTDDYAESNTRFLLQHDNWRGVIINGGTSHQRFIERRGIIWQHDIMALSAWVTRENVGDLVRSAGLEGDIGLLSLDVDGNDYWILEQLLSFLTPRILIAEYNALFGPDLAISVPYRPDFAREIAHHSTLYYGASLSAITCLAEQKGYRLLGCTSAGNNAFYVRSDVLSSLRPVSVKEAFVQSRFRESRDKKGRLTAIGPLEKRREIVANLPVVEVTSGKVFQLKELFRNKHER